MYDLLRSYKTFDNFIKMQLLNVMVACFSWSLIIPIITKLQGTLWAAYMISGFLSLNQLSAFVSPFFKHISLKTAYIAMIALSIIYFCSLILYFYDPYVFLYTESVLMFLYGITMSIYSINYDVYIMNRYNQHVFKDIQYINRMLVAGAAILGYGITAMIDLVVSNIATTIICFMVMLGISLCIELVNYNYFWKNIE